MTGLEHIRAKFAVNMACRRTCSGTRNVDGDHGRPRRVPENLLLGILGMRRRAIAIDTPRSERWSTPEDIDVIADLAYLPDGMMRKPGSAADTCLICICRITQLRGGHTPPVYIDIHGGGFTYGYKELNRNFNVHPRGTGLRGVFIELSSGAADRLPVGNWPISRRHCVDRSPYGRFIRSIRTRCPHRRFRRWR